MTTLLIVLTLMLLPPVWEGSVAALVRARSRHSGDRPNIEDGE